MSHGRNENHRKGKAKVASEAKAAKAAKAEVVSVERKGERIIIPEGMPYENAVEWLNRMAADEKREVGIYELIEAHPVEGLVALNQALAEKYGWVNAVPTPSFFGSNPPTMVGVRTGPKPSDTVSVPFGRIQLPNVPGYVDTQIGMKDEQPVLVLGGKTLAGHVKAFQEIAALAREKLKTNSIYRGKAIKVRFTDDEGDQLAFDINDTPQFLDTEDVRAQELVFSDEVNEQINVSLFTPVEQTDLCRKHKIPLKRGVLLEGPYGTGKTLTAWVAAKKCVENGWTFIYLNRVSDLDQALTFAQRYQPAMIFAEDIDRALSGDRSVDMDDILNTIDGIEAKNAETIVALTTNHVENINQAMLRPGRLDAVVSVRAPDAKAATRLMRLYGRDMIDEKEDLSDPAVRLNGQIPAVIREVVERAKLAAISRGGNGGLKLTKDDLRKAADGMLAHLRLLAPRPEDKRTDFEKLGHSLGVAIGVALKKENGALNNVAALPHHNNQPNA